MKLKVRDIQSIKKYFEEMVLKPLKDRRHSAFVDRVALRNCDILIDQNISQFSSDRSYLFQDH